MVVKWVNGYKSIHRKKKTVTDVVDELLAAGINPRELLNGTNTKKFTHLTEEDKAIMHRFGVAAMEKARKERLENVWRQREKQARTWKL